MTGTSNWMRVRNARSGLTLIEIIVGLVLMAMVLASAVLAQRRHADVARRAQNVELVVAAADGILEQLYARRGGFPRRARGRFESLPQYTWVTRPVRREVLAGVPVEIVRWTALGPDRRSILDVDVCLASDR